MAAELSKQRIQANLRRWASHGLVATNPAHIRAYMLARQQTDRVKPEMVLANLASETQHVQSGVRMTSSYYLAAKSNFGPAGPLAHLQRWLITEAELRSNHAALADSEFDSDFIFDGACDVQSLGQRVKRIAFEDSLSTVQTAASRRMETDAPEEASADVAPVPSTPVATPAAAQAPKAAAKTAALAPARAASSAAVLGTVAW